MTKRAKGTGSVYLRGDGRWVAKVVDPATGKARARYARDEARAWELLAEMTAKAATGDVVVDSRVTVKAYADAWLDGRAGRRRAESTLYEYESRLRNHVYPHLGRVRLAALTIPRVEAWLDALLDEGLAPATVKACRNTLAAILSDAVRSRVLSVNVARAAEMPFRGDAPPAKVVPPTPDQVRDLLRVADEDDVEVARLLRVIAFTGSRIGEALAMTWDDVDLDNGVWHIARTVTRDRVGRSRIGDTTKTRSTRTVRLPDPAVDVLRAQRSELRRRRLGAAVWIDAPGGGFVWPTVIGTAPDAANVRRRIRAVAQAAGVAVTAKGLRHLFASIAVESVEVAVVSKMLGHARVSTTADTYAHLRPETRDTVADHVARTLDA